MTLTKQDLETEKRELMISKAKLSFRHFLPFVKVSVPGVGMMPIEVWPYVDELVTDLENDRLMVRPKSRKIGMTTSLSAYALWHAQFIPLALVLCISKGELDAYDFLGKSRDTYEALSPELQIPLGQGTDLPNNREQMSFANGSKIRALPSTPNAGRGPTPTLVIFDEADYHEYLDSAYNSVKPGVDDNGGQIIMTSTIHEFRMGTLFQNICNHAPANGFTERFYGWRERPDRTQEWWDARRQESQDKALFEKEHAGTREEAFAPAKSIAFFDRDILMAMKEDTKKPVEVILMGNGVEANIYQKFQAGKRYTAATDSSHGVGQDDSVTVILDVTTGVTVADIHSNVIDATEFAIASIELLNMYDCPIWAPEDNSWGVLVIRCAQELRYKRLYYREPDKPGWHTFDTAAHAAPGSRFVMWGDLKRAIASRLITIFNAQGLAQFLTVIRNPRKLGRIEAQEGAKDDYPMAVGIAWQIRDQARRAGQDRGKRRERNGQTRDDEFTPIHRGQRGKYSYWGR